MNQLGDGDSLAQARLSQQFHRFHGDMAAPSRGTETINKSRYRPDFRSGTPGPKKTNVLYVSRRHQAKRL